MAEVEQIFIEAARKSAMIGVCESLTGGQVASLLVDTQGASKYFYEGIVAYSNESKRDRLNVSDDTIKELGAVSAEVAEQMALGLYKNGKKTVKGEYYTVSTTGIAGPGGGSGKKPVGLTYIGICANGKTQSYKYTFNGTRSQVSQQAAQQALVHLLEAMTSE